MVEELIADGMAVLPGIGSDIADPDVVEIAYEGTPLQPLWSMFHEGVKPRCDNWGSSTAPLLLFTSSQDHVVDPADSVHLATTHGGPVEHVWLERSFHVATQDYDRDLICERTLAFLATVS